jgi:hypothetical protein
MAISQGIRDFACVIAEIRESDWGISLIGLDYKTASQKAIASRLFQSTASEFTRPCSTSRALDTKAPQEPQHEKDQDHGTHLTRRRYPTGGRRRLRAWRMVGAASKSGRGSGPRRGPNIGADAVLAAPLFEGGAVEDCPSGHQCLDSDRPGELGDARGCRQGLERPGLRLGEQGGEQADPEACPQTNEHEAMDEAERGRVQVATEHV